MSRTYAMLDLEFTSLDLQQAHLTEWGIVVFDPLTFTPTLEFGRRCGVAQAFWNPATLNWAREKLASTVFNEVAPKDVHSEYFEERREFLFALFSTLDQLVRTYGKDKLHLVVNHPECDVTLLRNQYKLFELDYPIHYQNHKDMDSLMMAAAGSLYDYTYAAWEHQKGNGAPHTAIEDCKIQIQKLKFFGVELP